MCSCSNYVIATTIRPSYPLLRQYCLSLRKINGSKGCYSQVVHAFLATWLWIFPALWNLGCNVDVPLSCVPVCLWCSYPVFVVHRLDTTSLTSAGRCFWNSYWSPSASVPQMLSPVRSCWGRGPLRCQRCQQLHHHKGKPHSGNILNSVVALSKPFRYSIWMLNRFS